MNQNRIFEYRKLTKYNFRSCKKFVERFNKSKNYSLKKECGMIWFVYKKAGCKIGLDIGDYILVNIESGKATIGFEDRLIFLNDIFAYIPSFDQLERINAILNEEQV